MHSISFILLAFSVTVIQSLPQNPTDNYPKPIQISSNDVGDNGNFLLPGSTDSSGEPTVSYNENPPVTTGDDMMSSTSPRIVAFDENPLLQLDRYRDICDKYNRPPQPRPNNIPIPGTVSRLACCGYAMRSVYDRRTPAQLPKPLPATEFCQWATEFGCGGIGDLFCCAKIKLFAFVSGAANNVQRDPKRGKGEDCHLIKKDTPNAREDEQKTETQDEGTQDTRNRQGDSQNTREQENADSSNQPTQTSPSGGENNMNWLLGIPKELYEQYLKNHGI